MSANVQRRSQEQEAGTRKFYRLAPGFFRSSFVTPYSPFIIFRLARFNRNKTFALTETKTNFMRKSATLVVLGVVLGWGAAAQSTGKISGTVNDEAGKALPAVDVGATLAGADHIRAVAPEDDDVLVER